MDEIVELNDDFVSFANQNGWAIDQSDLLGRSMWDFVTGDAAAALHRTVLTAVRMSGRPLKLPMRCDSPDERRWFMARIRAFGDGTVEYGSTLERVERREHSPLFEFSAGAADPDEPPLEICAWCARCRVEGEWLDATEAGERLGLLADADAPRVSHGVCESCERRVLDAVGG